jgi:transposase
MTDAEWRLIKEILPSKASPRGRPAYDNRAVVNGVLWQLRTGASWPDLPGRYGNWPVAYQRFRRWRALGTWERVASTLAQLRAGNSPCSINNAEVQLRVVELDKEADGFLGTRNVLARRVHS